MITATATIGAQESSTSLSEQSFTTLATTGTVFRYVSDRDGLIVAIEAANSDLTNAYVVMMQPGTYDLTDQQPGTFSLLPVIYGNVTLIGIDSYRANLHPDNPAASKVIIQRASSAPEIDFFNIQAGASLSLYNVILRNAGGASRFAGGAIVNGSSGSVRGLLRIYNSVLENNTAGYWAGAIYNNGGDLQIVNTIFRNNRTLQLVFSNLGGGAIANNQGIVGGTFTVNGVNYETGCITLKRIARVTAEPFITVKRRLVVQLFCEKQTFSTTPR